MENDKTILSEDKCVQDELRREINATLGVIFSLNDEKAFSPVDPYKLRKKIDELLFLPEKGLGFDNTLENIKESVIPYLIKTWSKEYMPHLHSPVLLESIASELLLTLFNDSMDSWDQGPSATEVECKVIDELCHLFGYGKDSSGSFTSGGSASNSSSLYAARDYYIKNKLGVDVKKYGVPDEGKKLRLYVSELSHFSFEKTAYMLGLGSDSVRKVPSDENGRMDISIFKKMVEDDIKDGLLPFFAVATIGTTDFGSIDDALLMREICDKYDMHLHLDAAYGSALIMSSKYSKRFPLCISDSITIDFHKMFLLPISCSAVLFRDKEKMNCFTLHADYLNREEDEEEGYINLVDRGAQTTRRFDALKVLFSFECRGKDGYDKIVTHLIDNAEFFYLLLSSDDDFYLPLKGDISIVTFSYKKNNEVNKKIRKTLLNDGIVIGQTTYKGLVMLKVTLLNPNVQKEDLIKLKERIKQIGSSLC